MMSPRRVISISILPSFSMNLAISEETNVRDFSGKRNERRKEWREGYTCPVEFKFKCLNSYIGLSAEPISDIDIVFVDVHS